MSDISNIVEELVDKRFRDLIIATAEGDEYDSVSYLRLKVQKKIMEVIDEELLKRQFEIRQMALGAFTKWFDGVEPVLLDHHQIIFRNKKADNIACVPKE